MRFVFGKHLQKKRNSILNGDQLSCIFIHYSFHSKPITVFQKLGLHLTLAGRGSFFFSCNQTRNNFKEIRWIGIKISYTRDDNALFQSTFLMHPQAKFFKSILGLRFLNCMCTISGLSFHNFLWIILPNVEFSWFDCSTRKHFWKGNCKGSIEFHP